MNNEQVQKRDRRVHRVIIVQAILCAILFHLFLAFGFTFKKDRDPGLVGTPVANYMISMDDSSKNTVQLKTWLRYNDPSLFIKPSRKYGFSSVAHEIKINRLPGDMKTSIPKQFKFKSKAAHGVKPLINRPPGSLAGYELTSLPSSQVKEEQPGPSRFPALLDDANQVILYPNGKIALSVAPPLSRTVLKVYAASDKLFARVVLARTCGNGDLDRVALKTVLQACVSGKISVERDRNVTFVWGEKSAGGKK